MPATLAEVAGDLRGLRDSLASRLASARSLQDGCQRFATALYEQAPPAIALSRVYATVRFRDLPAGDRVHVVRTLGRALPDETLILSLLGTRGAQAAWNDRMASRGHLAIPLLGAEHVDGIPMIARLLAELGIELVEDAGGSLVARRMIGGLNTVFYVEDATTAVDARGRHIIPARDFVAQQRIMTVFGMGGAYLDGTLVTAILFTRELLPRRTAEALATTIARLKIATEGLVSARRLYG